MNPLQWRNLDAAALAELLGRATVQDSRAVGESTVYEMQCEGRALLAIALQDGQAIVVERAPRIPLHRRSIDHEALPAKAPR